MKNFLRKNVGTIAFFIAVVISVCFIAHAAVLGTEYSKGVQQRASDRAAFYTEEVAYGVKERCDEFKRETAFMASKLSGFDTKEEALEEFKNIYLLGLAKDDFITAFYLKNGMFMSIDGVAVSGYPEINELKDADGEKLSKVFQYDNRIMTVAAIAKTGGGYADGVVTLYDRADLSLADFKENGEKSNYTGVTSSEFTALIRYDGKPIDRIENSKTFTVGNATVQNGVFATLLTPSENSEAVHAISGGKNAAFVFMQGADDYVLAINSLGAENGYLAVVSVYKISVIYGQGYSVMESVWASILGLSFIMIIMTASMIISRLIAKRKIYNLEMTDAALNCATPKKFERVVEAVTKRHKNLSFAIVSLKINNFSYVAERYGAEASQNVALFTVAVIRHALFIDESFAYAGDGEFLLLLYYKDRKTFIDRLNGLYLRLVQYEGLKEHDYKVNASFAVYEIEKDEKQTVKNMFNKLKLVKDSSGARVGSFTVEFYEDVLNKQRLRKAEIEGRMESALENSEFHLFYQPKYNFHTKKMDGSEILIRWYDPKIESYRLPALFLPVFEEDGFISKIDRFVFYKACENIAARAAERKICYPVSVNVSRVTAIQPDFVDYYIRIKKKFNIKDNFITLEFTESFAYENYAYLSEMVAKLHENGFLCSIDDFGTGYSSYNILKTITADEIKLDKFFLERGISEERDQTLLNSVIDMIKKLGIKVTQEGVETREDFERLKLLGCDVIQGYFFAKPMKYVDYCEFIEKNYAQK